MSGFLQRLASGVLHTQQAIHPAAGTIWSAAGMAGQEKIASPGTAEPIESSVEVRVPAWQRSVDASELPATQRSTQQPVKPQIQPAYNGLSSDSAVRKNSEQAEIAEAAAFHPLVAPAHQRVVSTAPAAPQADAVTHQSKATPSPRHQQQVHPIETAPLLVPSPRIHASAIAGARKASSFLQPSSRRAQPAQSQTAEPDSIEIHIGRIEVLAAPPRPAQPAAPRSPRKSLDLGEYLRRERRPR
jgi:hypothetical protein